MAVGRYTVMDGSGNPVGTEEFRCAPGPMGWRYFSDVETSVPEPHHEVIDLTVDADWRPVRTRIQTGSHEIELSASTDRLSGFLDGLPVRFPWGLEHHLDYLSPAFNAATTNRLSATGDIDVVYLDPVTCEPRSVRQRYELLGSDEVATPVGRFAAVRWRYTAMSSGWSRDLWVAADVVVRYEDVFELAWYEPGASGPLPRS
ncbi:MAG TPA: hypothetical protein VE646_05125 [Actinomycetota bacterium]|nr:hypothetical protein [Actinomycetota bacterium]